MPPSGLEAAQAAGCFTLAVVTTTPREALDADAIVSDLSEVRFEADQQGHPREAGRSNLRVPFDKLRARLLKLKGRLARLAPEGALGFRRTVSMHVLWTVVDVVLALTTLLGRQGLTELALGVVLG